MYCHIAAAGTTKRLRKRIKAGGNTTKGKTGVQWRSYCPFCKASDPSKPQFSPHVKVANIFKRPKNAKCHNGHTWPVVK